MTRRRFFLPREHIRNGIATLPPQQAHHLRHVLRVPAGSEVELFDGCGGVYRGTVEFHGTRVRVVSLREVDSAPEPRSRLILGAALIKPDRFELVLEKGTELGVDEFVPLLTRFCNVRIPENRLEERMKRWERIVQEACRQCGRASVPAVGRPAGFAGFLEENRSRGSGFLLYENAAKCRPLHLPQSDRIVLCVGPEGGWDEAEVRAAENAGWEVFRLGSTILRAETAAIAAVALFRLGVDTCAGFFQERREERRGCGRPPGSA